ncbi:MAG: recombinase family protein [Propioniciclava sp.]
MSSREQPAQLRAAIYVRISLDPEQTRLGVERHREDAQRLADFRRYQVVNVYEDNDVTGSGRRRRPEFERLLADIEADRVDVVIAQEWPRLERNRTDGVRVIEAAKDHHVLLTFVKGSDIDCSTAAGRLAADMFSAFARNEIEVKSERQSGAQSQRARQGRVPKGTRPLGYAVDGSTILHEAEAVRAIYSAFVSGVALNAIAKALSGDARARAAVPGVPQLPNHSRTLMIERNKRREEENRHLPKELHKWIRPVPEDRAWSTSTILGILRNPRYAGYSTYQKKSERPSGYAKDAVTRLSKRRALREAIVRDEHGMPVPPNGWEAIVSEAQWWTAQAMLDDEARATNRVGTERRHVGSGLYMCGECGKEKRQKLRSHSRGYECHVCGFHRTREPIDDLVDRKVRERLDEADLRDLLVGADDPRVAVIAQAVESQQARIARADDDYAAENIDGPLYRRIVDAAKTEIARLEKERLELTAGSAAADVLGAGSPAEAFANADLATRRAVIDELVDVYVKRWPRGKKGFDESSVEIVRK